MQPEPLHVPIELEVVGARNAEHRVDAVVAQQPQDGETDIVGFDACRAGGGCFVHRNLVNRNRGHDHAPFTYTGWPPTQVCATPIRAISESSVWYGSWVSTAKSARLPTSSEPRSSSRPSARAAEIV